jgi:hypothetical protein
MGKTVDINDGFLLAHQCILAYTKQAIPLEDAWCEEHWPRIYPKHKEGDAFRRLYDEGILPDGRPVTEENIVEAVIEAILAAGSVERDESQYPRRPRGAEEVAFSAFIEAFQSGKASEDDAQSYYEGIGSRFQAD